MKKLLCLLLILALILPGCGAQTVPETTGAVLSAGPSGEPEASIPETSVPETTVEKATVPTDPVPAVRYLPKIRTYYSETGEVVSTQEWTYDDQGRTVTFTHDPLTREPSVTEYVYFEDHHEERSEVFGSPYVYSYTTDQDGNITKIEHYVTVGAELVLASTREMTYNASGLAVRAVGFGPGIPSYESTCEYDGYGNAVRQEDIEGDVITVTEYLSTYDGELRTQLITLVDGAPIEKAQYTYDSQGLLVLEVITDTSTGEMTVTSYIRSAGRAEKMVEVFADQADYAAGDPKFSELTITDYDEYGNEIRVELWWDGSFVQMYTCTYEEFTLPG